jgi:hypothetical protein
MPVEPNGRTRTFPSGLPSDPDLSAEDVALGYKNLLEVHRGFRDLKSTIEVRPGVPPDRAPHPRGCPALLARAAADPGRRAPYRTDLARHRPQAGPPVCDHLSGPADTVVQTNEAHHRPVEDSSGLRARPANPDHRPRPHLNCENTPTDIPVGHGHPHRPRAHVSCRSTRRFRPHVCPRTAKPGPPRRDNTGRYLL